MENVQEWETLGFSAWNGISSSNSSPQASGKYTEEETESLREPEVVDDSNETSSRHNSTDTYVNSQRLTAQTKTAQV